MSKYTRDSLHSIFGQVVPMVVAVAAIPVLVRHLGVSRLGLLSIAWVIVGYSGFLDLGLSRSLIQIVADLRGRGREDEIPAVFWTALLFVLPLGVAASFVLFTVSDVLCQKVLKVPSGLEAEAILALKVFSFSVAPAILTPFLQGFLTAYRRFDLINYVKIPVGVLMTGGPAVVALAGGRLPEVMIVLVASRVAGLLWSYCLCARVYTGLGLRICFEKTRLKPLLNYGLWITVSNVVTPLLVYSDRFVIGALLSVALVTYYTTPLDALTKMLVLPISLSAALFPLIAEMKSLSLDSCRRIARGTLEAIFLVMYPACLVVGAFCHLLLTLWLGSDFASQAENVVRIVAIGIIFNGLAQVPATVIQALGAPEVTGKLQAAEFVIYVPLLWYVVKFYGITGAAIAWTVRVVVDAILLFMQCSKIMKGHGLLDRREGVRMAVFALLALVIFQVNPVAGRALLSMIALAFFVFAYRSRIQGFFFQGMRLVQEFRS